MDCYGDIFYKYKYYGYDDAIYASLKLINIINDKKTNLSNLIGPYIKSLSTPEIKLYCEESIKFNLLNEIIIKLKKSGHVLAARTEVFKQQKIEPHWERLDLNGERYFNAGVLLIDYQKFLYNKISFR